jgi:hypothetical protein
MAVFIIFMMLIKLSKGVFAAIICGTQPITYETLFVSAFAFTAIP